MKTLRRRKAISSRRRENSRLFDSAPLEKGSAYFDPQSKFLVLDLLVDGPGSFMSLYGELTWHHAFPPDVNLLMNHL